MIQRRKPLRRTPLKRSSKPLRRSAPIARISSKRAQALAAYYPAREKFLKERPMCERCTRQRSRDVHHVCGRLGGGMLDTSTWRALCRDCHDWVHSNASEARATGWLKS